MRNGWKGILLVVVWGLLIGGAALAQELKDDAEKALYGVGYRLGNQFASLELTEPQQAQALAGFKAGAKTETPKFALTGDALVEGLKSRSEEGLYSQGFKLGGQAAPMQLTDPEMTFLCLGFQEGVKNLPPKIDPKAYRGKLGQLFKDRIAAFQIKEDAKREARNKEYLVEAAKASGAEKTNSGLIFFDLTPGTGPSPTAKNKVRVHYRGTLIDGYQFDSSYDRGAPSDLGLKDVIRCWTEGLQKMKVGGKAKLVCPADIAYGQHSQGAIPAGSTLIFEVELLEILN